MAFKTDKQRRYVMGKLKGFFVEKSRGPPDIKPEDEIEHPFDYKDYRLGTKEGRHEARVAWAMKKRGLSKEEAEDYVGSHPY